MSTSSGKILTYLNAGCPLIILDQKKFVDIYVLSTLSDKNGPCEVCPVYEFCTCEVKNKTLP